MSSLFYRLFGYTVWQGLKLYLRRRYARLIPSRRAVLISLAGLAGAGIAVGMLSRRTTTV